VRIDLGCRRKFGPIPLEHLRRSRAPGIVDSVGRSVGRLVDSRRNVWSCTLVSPVRFSVWLSIVSFLPNSIEISVPIAPDRDNAVITVQSLEIVRVADWLPSPIDLEFGF